MLSVDGQEAELLHNKSLSLWSLQNKSLSVSPQSLDVVKGGS